MLCPRTVGLTNLSVAAQITYIRCSLNKHVLSFAAVCLATRKTLTTHAAETTYHHHAATLPTSVRRCVCAHWALVDVLWRRDDRFGFTLAGCVTREFVVSSKSTNRV